MKKILLILAITAGFVYSYTALAGTFSLPSCPSGNYFKCGIETTGNELQPVGVITGKGIAQAVQDFIVYLLSFLSLIAVIYVMYAGAQLMLNPSDEESAAKTKKIIVGVISGIVIIWFAWWIVSLTFSVINKASAPTAYIPRVLAETGNRNVDFTTYSNRIEALKTKIDTGYSSEVINDLSLLVDGAYDHLPDRADLYGNKRLYDEVKQAIVDYTSEQDSLLRRASLQTALERFKNIKEDNTANAKVYTISSRPDVNPNQGSAPLSVTLEAKQTIDESGTVIPNDNYIWWLRTGENNNKILGKGKIINYTFNTEGTYMVFLTINSASKNSKGFTDTISYESSVTVEVTQPEIHFVVKINDQLAGDVVKVSTKEALNPIRIDASETRFASGYTTKSTVWDFGNGNNDTNEGNPQFEVQPYTPGDHTIRLKLTRNDGEEFSYTTVLKIGDPLAAISTSTRTPNKGEKVIFQAKKTSNEPDVQYLWEVSKQGDDTILYTFSGTRLEYVFRDTGRYFVSLTSIKGDARDKDTMEVVIESRPPNAQFTSEMVNPETPNIYAFDGSNSFDPDYPDNQKLRFEWFVNDTSVQLLETNERNSRGKYVFPEKGAYRVVLRVTDEEGKSTDYKRDIKITSILSVSLNMRPEVARRGAKVLLSVTSPDAKAYEWKVGTNDPVRTESNRLTTSFPLSGIFPVTIVVTDAEGNTNSATRKIYVAEDNQPFSILDIKSDSSLSIAQKSVCSGEEAITVDRANSVSFSSERSVNTDGRNNDLTYFWKIGLNKTSTQKNVSYTFDELGCEEIILTVSDKITGSSHTSKTWVKVVNLAPIFSDIQVTVANLDTDPMQINLKIVGAKDPDGVIRSYTWYYYTDRDDQAQGFRITRLPEATFVLPKISGRYYFAVMMEDSNGLKINTKESSDVAFSTPDLYINTNLATPIIDNFTANNLEVKYGDVTRLSLDVRTPLVSDVSGQAEYRWDIDGDGFYDVKTSTPFYEFKYVYPGEYHPKVKVTHKGMSATKSLTIVVKNTLTAKATVQIIGNKIIAYNVSSGIFQGANWYLDDKKISENKDYLVFETETDTAQNLKLEITDGKDTVSAVYPVQRNLKNKILLKNITQPLVVLSAQSGADIKEVTDDIVWEDPMTPLYIYLGESRGDIRYYVIDTDIDIDTDLSGGKDDDADNKGTASYRSGRPFQVPKGSKRVTIMKLRIIGQNNQDIDSRQIRVTRKFLAITESELIPDTTAPKAFNLTQEDKDRIEKLRNLVLGASGISEDEKSEFNKMLDQLGDNWYDTADRIQTLDLFANFVNTSPTLSADLKKKIQEQINLIYTQGDDQIEERQLALKMVTDYLAKSPKRLQIFGDDQTSGLINEIIDNPEYYDANLKVVQKIMDDYVNPDTTLSPEVKKNIKEKLLILAGAPPAPDMSIVSPIKDSSTTGTLLLWILGGAMCIIFGLAGIIYVRKKMTPIQNGGGEENPENISESTGGDIHTASVGDTEPHDSTPDWLKEGGSPFGDEDVFSSNTTETTPDAHQPDWVGEVSAPKIVEEKDASTSIHQKEEEVSPEENQTHGIPTESNMDEDIPDWLQGVSTEEDSTPSLSPSVEEETLPQDEPNKTEETGGDVSEQQIAEESKEIESLNGTPDTTAPTMLSPEENTGEETPSIEAPSNTVTEEDEDIPDWLRGAMATESTPSPVGDIAEDATTLVPEETPPLEEGTISSQEVSQKPGENLKKEIIEPVVEDALLGMAENLLEPAQDTLIMPPVSASKKKTAKKKTDTVKSKAIPSDHLLESEHDMLLPTTTEDTSL